MGREIRMVPENWDHPKTQNHSNGMEYHPMFDRCYEKEKKEWIDGLMAWEDGTHPDKESNPECEYWDWDGSPPDKEYYRPWSDDEAVWFQVWETVSEGTPVTPPFATRKELADYLVENGDDWDQRRGNGGWSRESADDFCSDGGGFRPTLMFNSHTNEMKTSRDIM